LEIYENRDLKDLESEVWKDIEEYGGDYQISNYGRIKSFKQRKEGKILSQNKNSAGYLCVGLCKNRKGEPKLIHDLLFETFNNYKLKENECIHHIDFNKLNNDLNNFQLMTISEHMSLHHKNKIVSDKTKQLMIKNHADVSGENNPMYGKTGENNPFYGKNHSEETKQLMREKKSGENNPHVKLTKQDIIKIRELNLTQKEIGRMFGVHQATISAIKNRRSWKHI